MSTLNKKLAPRYITGLLTMVLSVYFLVEHRQEPVIIIASVFFLLICATDTFNSRIPNLANLTLLLTGFGYNFWLNGTPGLGLAALGAMVGFALFLLPYAMGGMGAGDVKALTALGALLGATGVFQVFLYTALFGGLMAILHFVLNRDLKQNIKESWQNFRLYLYSRDLKYLSPSETGVPLKFPYAAAIALGFFAHTHWGGPL